MRRFALSVLLCLSACTRAAQLRATPAEAPFSEGGPAVPAGTLFAAQLRQPLSTAGSQPGDLFTAEVLDPLIAEDGTVVVAAGARLRGVVKAVQPSSRAGKPAVIAVDLTEVEGGDASSLPLPAEVASASLSQSSVAGRAFLGVVAGAAVGLVAGLLIDDSTGAAVAGGTGGASLGAALALALGRRDASLPAGSVITLRLVDPLPAHAARERPRQERLDPANERK